MYLRKITVLLICVMMLAGIIGTTQAQDDVTLRYFMWDPSFEAEELEMVGICEAELGINVEMEVIGTPDYWTRMNAMAAADDLPDVFSMSSGFVAEWMSDGLLLNIEDYIQADIMPNAENYFTGVIDVARDADGNAHAFPFAFVETVLFYNQDAFDEAGLEYPSMGWTWDDFLAAAQALTTDDEDGDGLIDRYGFWHYGRYAHIESWVYQNGGRFLTDNNTVFAPDANAVEALAFLDSLINEHGVAPQPADLEGIRQQDVFPMGLAAMWVDGAWNISNNRTYMADNTEFTWGVAPIPRGPNAEGDIAYGWPDLMGIASNTEHPDESWAFVQCMTGPLRTVELTFPGKIPVYRPTAESDAWLELDQQPANKAFLLEWAQYTGPTSFTPGWGEWRGYTDGAGLEGQLNEVFNGNNDLETAIEEVTAFANEVLGRYFE